MNIVKQKTMHLNHAIYATDYPYGFNWLQLCGTLYGLDGAHFFRDRAENIFQELSE